MSNNSNYSGISNKTDACQMVEQMSEEDQHHFCRLSKEGKVELLCGLCQAETGFLWSGLEIEEDHTGENSEEIPVEGETEEHQASVWEKRVSKVHQGAARTRP
ncbi:hypothetical protein DSO57_1028180 [Entomophthora muscae]|uniref:Uncharacterized protein n=1 Tax=Entomophthora muscae TaxID=34485 RepID=A0ACC2UNJ3_9FUNG|nr:hypothetical protein DSO57_1028180 [Entomophthora muscae]